MAYVELTKSLIVAGKELLPLLFQRVRENFIDHESRISALESEVSVLPPGVIIETGAASAPTGFLLCNGAAVSRGTYAALFAVIGDTYGAGDGSTTFNVPDFKGRVAVGSGTGPSLTARTLAAKIGAETHTLTQAELPSHNHAITDPGHSHTYPNAHNDGAGSSGVPLFRNGTSAFSNQGANGSPTQSATTGISLSNTGLGQAHSNIQPSTVCNFLIKT